MEVEGKYVTGDIESYTCSCPLCGTILISASSVKNGTLKCSNCKKKVKVTILDDGECIVKLITVNKKK